MFGDDEYLNAGARFASMLNAHHRRTIAAFFAPLLVCCLANAQAATDLVGRNGEFTVVEKGGKVQKVDTTSLTIKDELRPSAPRAVIEDADGSKPAKDDPNAPKNAGKKPAAAAKPKEAEPKEDTPEEIAARAKDVEELRAMRKEGGTYFYTEDDKPVSFEEIDRRIATGEVEGLKVIGLHLDEWKPRTKAKDSASSESAPSQAPAEPEPVPAPVKKRY